MRSDAEKDLYPSGPIKMKDTLLQNSIAYLQKMDVFPSGVVITPVDRQGKIHAHIAVVSHFNLKGTISSQLLERI